MVAQRQSFKWPQDSTDSDVSGLEKSSAAQNTKVNSGGCGGGGEAGLGGWDGWRRGGSQMRQRGACTCTQAPLAAAESYLL